VSKLTTPRSLPGRNEASLRITRALLYACRFSHRWPLQPDHTYGAGGVTNIPRRATHMLWRRRPPSWRPLGLLHMLRFTQEVRIRA